ncbi:MAG TPA: ElyC/SanA/YdcF family protein [Polyangiaceae bacterium]|nr:ElyC/SanA/YdcF family protein [Polyangiaceae bacterium]
MAAHFIERRAAPFVTDRIEQLPRMKVGLLLGCSERLSDGRTNLFFRKRIAAAARLFRARKLDYFLVSGDNSHPGYDEPNDMRRALLAEGVPSSRIVLDYAGFLDSVVRAKEVFGLQRFTVVSQRFHDVRAVYLARAHGVEAYGYAAADVGGTGGVRVRLRELFSRAFALLDVSVLASRPRFSGPRQHTVLEPG